MKNTTNKFFPRFPIWFCHPERSEGPTAAAFLARLSSTHFFRPQEQFDFRCAALLFSFLPILVRRTRKRLKQRVRFQRLRFEFRMKLAPDEEWMTGNLNHLDISAVWSRPRNAQTSSHHRLFILAVELVTMTVAFADLGLAVNLRGQSSRFDLARPRTETHRAAQLLNAAQLAQLVDHTMRSRRIKLARVGIGQTANVARILNTS